MPGEPDEGQSNPHKTTPIKHTDDKTHQPPAVRAPTNRHPTKLLRFRMRVPKARASPVTSLLTRAILTSLLLHRLPRTPEHVTLHTVYHIKASITKKTMSTNLNLFQT